MSRLPLFAFLLAIAVIPTAIAQPYQEQVTVNVVEVPVWVSSIGGSTVKNLKASDFELYVNGEPQPIEYFDVLVEETKKTNVPPAASVQERPELHRRRLYLLLFDLTTLSMQHAYKARDAALKFVSEAPAGDTFAVATLRQTGIHFAAPFTTDRVAIERAIRTLRASWAGDAFNLATLETERAALASISMSSRMPSTGQWDAPGVGPMVGFGGPASSLAIASSRKVQEIEAVAATQVRERAIDNLAVLADSLARLSGVKHVIMLGEGQPTETSVLDEGVPSYLTYLTRVHERYRAAGVTLNAVDLRPHVPGGGADNRAATDTGGLMRDAQGFIKTLAGGTGGMVAYNFKAIREQHSVTYVLGFKPRAEHVRKENAIRVKVRNAPFGSFVRHRQSFSMEPAAKASEGLFLADVLQNDIEQNGMTVDVDIQRQGEDVTLVASVPGQEVLGYGSDGATVMDVFLYVFDEQAVVAWWTHVQLKVDVEAAREYLSSNPYRIRQQMRLGPGRYAAKALLRVIGRDATGFQRTDFEIPKG